MRYDDHKWKPGRRRNGTPSNWFGSVKRMVKWEYRSKSRATTRSLVHKVLSGKVDPEEANWPKKMEASNWWNWD